MNTISTTGECVVGYVVDSFYRIRKAQYELFYICRLEDGRTCGIYINNFQPHLYIRASDHEKASGVVRSFKGKITFSDRRTMDNECVYGITNVKSPLRTVMETLHKKGIGTYEADIRPTDQFLMEHGIHSVVAIEGVPETGRNLDIFFTNPDLKPAIWAGELSILSFDIETDPDCEIIYAIAIAGKEGRNKPTSTEVFIVGKEVENAVSFETEKEMLLHFMERVQRFDPDIITGWNINDFDFRVLIKRCETLKIPFRISRTGSPLKIIGNTGNRYSSRRLMVEGRQVLDGMWLTRLSMGRFENYKLETVARALLGKGKKLDLEEGEDAARKIHQLYQKKPAELCVYCGEDARLVLEILEAGGVLDLTLEKSLTIGLPLSRVHMSIAAFERLYCEKLVALKMVSPSLGVDKHKARRVAGGGILTPKPGLFHHVLVFDFKSLYPSLMRTFSLDPLAYIQAQFDENALKMPNGARFARGNSIIGMLLDELMVKRDQARKTGNVATSYAYKIIMNSFYGVLGTDGCRFSNPDIAEAITSTGQFFLRWTRDLLQSWGFEVLYGDTDSLFIQMDLDERTGPAERIQRGRELSVKINKNLSDYIFREYAVESQLEIEFEKYYSRFLLPGLRSGREHRDVRRGRAKGYAGLQISISNEGVERKLDIVGLEAVRRDWTPLARNLQRELLGLIFDDRSRDEISSHIGQCLRALKRGELDAECVYKKALRKPVRSYTSSLPPHVRAASMLPSEQQKGLISYVWTRNGPEPPGFSASPLDLNHYRDKQIRPIVRSIDQIVKLELEAILLDNRQLDIFSEFADNSANAED